MSKKEFVPVAMQCYLLAIAGDNGMRRIFKFKPLGENLTGPEIEASEQSLAREHGWKAAVTTFFGRLADVPLADVPVPVLNHFYPEFAKKRAEELGIELAPKAANEPAADVEADDEAR